MHIYMAFMIIGLFAGQPVKLLTLGLWKPYQIRLLFHKDYYSAQVIPFS